jgi:plastocyanin
LPEPAAKAKVVKTVPGPRAHAASADPPVTIKDFSFGPATLTIHVGDTVTWTNQGPTEHTATGTNGSFNTGVLQKGHSASHTFGTAGTFPYFCALHPFMKASITVLAAATSSAPAPAPSAATPSPPASTPAPAATAPAAPQGPQLPVTGGDPLATAIWALGFLAAGLALRRRTRPGL